MATATQKTEPRPRIRWTTSEFDRLNAGGLVREGTRAYLWDGEIITPLAEDQPHVNAVSNLRRLLDQRLPADVWTVNQGSPLQMTDGFLPQPDLLVLRGPRADYRRRRPTPADVALLVEVADSTYPEDSGAYLRRYAMERVPQYWIVNIRGRAIEVYTDPRHDAAQYGARADYGLDAEVPLVLSREGDLAIFEGIDVRAVLADSLDEEP